MDESKDHESKGVNVLESIEAVKTVVTTTETVIRKVVEGGEVIKSQEPVGVSEKVVVEEEDGGACEDGDVMVEVLGSEVFVDGVRRVSGVLGSDELGAERRDSGARGGVGDDGGVSDREEDCGGGGSLRVDDLGDICKDDSASFVAEDLASRCSHEFVCGSGSSVADIGSKDSEARVKERVVEAAVEGLERKLGDEGEVRVVEFASNGTKLCDDLGSHTVEDKNDEVGNGVQDPISGITSTAEREKNFSAEESVEEVEEEDKAILSSGTVLESRLKEQVVSREDDEQGLSAASGHNEGNNLVDETVNGGVHVVETPNTVDKSTCMDCSSADLSSLGPEKEVSTVEQIQGFVLQSEATDTDVSRETGEEKPAVRDSVSRDSKNSNSELLNMQTQISTSENGDADNESVPVAESDMQAIDKKICESVKAEKSNDAPLVVAGVGHANGALDEMENIGDYMEIDAVHGNENQRVDMKVNDDGSEKNIDLASLSKGSTGETVVLGMDVDAADANSEQQHVIYAALSNDLKSNSDTVIGEKEPEAVIYPQCKVGATAVDESTKLSDPVASAIVDKQVMEAEDKILKIDEKTYKDSSILEADVPHVSVADSLVADVEASRGQDREDESEGHASHDQRSVPDNSAAKGVFQELECSDTSHVQSLDNCSADRVAHVGSNVEDVPERESPHSEQVVSMDNGSPSHYEPAKLLDPVTFDADGIAKVGSNVKDTLEGTYEHVVSVDISPSEEETMKLSSSVMSAPDAIHHGGSTFEENHEETANFFDPETSAADAVPQVGSDVKGAEEVQEAAAIELVPSVDNASPSEDEFTRLSYPLTSGADGCAQVGSNVDDAQEGREEFANNEQVVSMDNAALSGEETNNLLDPATSSMADTQDKLYAADGSLEMGHSFVRPEVSDVSIAGSSVAGFHSGPMHDGNEEYGDCVVHERLPFTFPTLLKGEDQGLQQMDTDDVADVDLTMEGVEEVQEQAASAEQLDLPEEQEVDEEPVSDSGRRRNKEEKNSKRASSKPGSLLKDHQISYQLPPENEGEFSVFDLVWGKVKSHPWWPGQIFHPSDSSEKAMKYYRKDCYLVAYFGDRTFAWNEASVLKPFRKHFPLAERQNKTEAFQNAVSCALAEVSRRIELGLACSCISEEAYDKIRYQVVENTGIQEESSKREGEDRCTGSDSLEPDSLVEYVRSLALFPTSGVDRLELVIAKAQLLAFHRLKGVDALAEFQYHEGLVEYDDDTHLGDQGNSHQNEHEAAVSKIDAKKGPKRKHNLKDIVYQRRKEKSMTELMGETMYYLDGEFDSHEEDDNLYTSPISTKRKASDDFTSQQSTKTISLAKVSHTASSTPQQSFKVGECIRRVASQLTGSPSIIKSGNDGGNNKHSADDADEVSESPNDSQTGISSSPSQESSLDEMLSQLHLSARDPMKGYSFLGDIIRFFAEFRNLAVTTQRQRMRKGSSRKRKSSALVLGTPESFEFDDRNDSYWTDMVVQNNADAKPSRRGRKRKDEQVGSGKPPQSNPRKYSRKQYFHGGQDSAAEVPPGDEKQQSQLPTELMMNFADMGSRPSEVNLNKMFRRFGPLKESETEVDLQSNRARVVFKKRSDAEVAYSSAAMFNIFGSAVVNYQLNYTPSVSFRTSPLALTEGVEDAT